MAGTEEKKEGIKRQHIFLQRHFSPISQMPKAMVFFGLLYAYLTQLLVWKLSNKRVYVQNNIWAS